MCAFTLHPQRPAWAGGSPLVCPASFRRWGFGFRQQRGDLWRGECQFGGWEVDPVVKETRRHRRESIDCEVALWWADPQRGKQFLRAQGLDLSDSGVLLESDEPLEVGTVVYVQAQEYGLARLARVRRCTPRGSKFRIGLELVDRKEEKIQPGDEDFVNYYELLQISSTAEQETIHRVYRILVSRYHPDNPDTGDSEKFLLLKQAYEVLSDPQTRAMFDNELHLRNLKPLEVFKLNDFLVGVDAESNRRLGILSLLYARRRTHPATPGMSLLEFEKLMAIPREHLEFTVWFLKESGRLRLGEQSDLEITVEGVEFIEARLPSNQLLKELLAASGQESHAQTTSCCAGSA